MLLHGKCTKLATAIFASAFVIAAATQPAGPPISTVQAIAIDPTNHNTIYAGVYSGSVPGGVFKSTDAGATWNLLNADTNFTVDVAAIVVDPVTPTTIYAGTLYTGILKSTDGGSTWNPMNTGLGSLPSPSSLAIDPNTPSTLYTTLIGGVYKSTDGGATWATADTGLSSVDVLGLTIDPTNSATIYARVNGGGVYKSTNAAASWVAMNTGLGSLYVYALAVNPNTPTTLYAATYDSGVFISTDGGAHWAASNSGLPNLHMGTVLAIDPAHPSTVYVASTTGLFKSLNGGATWTPADASTAATSFNGGSYFALTLDPVNSATLYLGTSLGGIYKSVDSAATWSAIDNGLNTAPDILGLAVARANPANVYVGALWYSASYLGGTFESPNGGTGWSAISLLLNGLQALAFDPSNPTTIYAGPSVGMVGFLSGGGAVKSTDGGVTWTAINSGLPTISGMANGSITTTFGGIDAFAVDPTNSQVVYSAPLGKVYKSVNAGGTWAPTSGAVPASSTVVSLAVDPSSSTTLYAGTSTGTIFKTVDGGSTWNLLNSNLPNVSIQALAVDSATPSTLYAGTNGSGLMISHDGGATWAAANSGLPNLSVTAVAANSSLATTIYIGTNGSGVFKSIDHGATWQPTGNNTGNGVAPATAISKVSGDNQSGSPGQPLAIPLVLVVTNAAHVPVAGVTVDFATTGGGTLSAISGVSNSQGVVSTSLTLGASTGPNTVTATPAGLNCCQVVFNATSQSATTTITSVSNSGSFTQSFAPGMLMSVFGTGLSSGGPQIPSSIPLPVTSASGTSVTINGIAAPLMYISATQINLQIPYEIPVGTANLVVKSGGHSASISFTIQAAGPGIFVDYLNGNVLPTESASHGAEIALYLTGAGQVSPNEPTGSVPASGATPIPNLPLTLTVGGVPVTPVYMGIPSWSVGVLQINFIVPASLAAGTQPVIVQIGGISSKPAYLTVIP